MSDIGETWAYYREDQKLRRAHRLPVRTEQILSLRGSGFIVEQKSEYHFRIDNVLDLWPTHNRYHDLRTNQRGGYKDAIDFVRRKLKK